MQANTNITPVEGADWTIVAQKGADGEAGTGGGTVTSVSATGPLTVTNGATTPQISLSGVIPVENGGTGSTTQNFVDLATTQSGIAGDKTFTGTLSGSTVNSQTQYNIRDSQVLSIGVGGSDNLFAGLGAGAANTTGNSNSLVGRNAGFSNTGGIGNSFFGKDAGLYSEGSNNSFVGAGAGYYNTTGSNNTLIGANADFGAFAGNLTFATAIGSGAVVSTSNRIALGRTNGSDLVQIFGLGAGGVVNLCLNPSSEISSCSSSLRDKTNIAPFRSGLSGSGSKGEIGRRCTQINAD